MMTYRIALATAAAVALATGASAVANPMVGGAAMSFDPQHRTECCQFQGPHDAGRGRQGRRPGRHLVGHGAVHGICAHQRSVREIARRHGCNPVKPENKAMLDKILTYHVVPGRITAQQMRHDGAQHGTATLKTVEGETLMFRKDGGWWWVIDAKGDKARITIANVMQSNGVIHVVDTVLMP